MRTEDLLLLTNHQRPWNWEGDHPWRWVSGVDQKPTITRSIVASGRWDQSLQTCASLNGVSSSNNSFDVKNHVRNCASQWGYNHSRSKIFDHSSKTFLYIFSLIKYICHCHAYKNSLGNALKMYNTVSIKSTHYSTKAVILKITQ